MKRATTAGNSGPAACERAVQTAGEEEHCQQQATWRKRAEGDDAGVRCRRLCSRQCLEVHQLQFNDKTIGIPAPAQKQTAVHSTELRTIRWWRRNSYRTIQKLPRIVETPQAQFMPPCHVEVLEIHPEHKSSTLRVSSTEWSTCPLLCEIMSPWSRQRRKKR